MDIECNKEVLDLQKLSVVTRGNSEKLRQYLVQFRELIPARVALMRQYMESEDRRMIRQTVHQVSPQLHYFGIRGIAPLIERVEMEYPFMPMDELKRTVSVLIEKMEMAKQEVSRILDRCD